MKKILVVFGTRPEAIKMAPVIKELKKSKKFQIFICVTAQHREMLDQVLEIFDILPDFDLNLMSKKQDLFDVTSDVILGLRDIINDLNPDLTLVHGDTTTAMAASLSCFYLQHKVAHVEAGLRTFNIFAPFPEEFNRRIVGILSNLHFSPTKDSKNNLINEGIEKAGIFVTGNTIIDAIQFVQKKINKSKKLKTSLRDSLESLINISLEKDNYILITGHRRENFGSGFKEICIAIKELSNKYPEYYFIYPVHLNPNVQDPVNSILNSSPNVKLIPPLDYLSFVMLLNHCYLVLTDSGGVQEEAPGLGKPVLVMRDTTERPEAVRSGTVKLVGSSKIKIVKGVSDLVEKKEIYKKMSKSHNPYGDGKASKKIRQILEKKIT